MINTLSGTPFTGYVSLTNAAPGPVNFAIFQVMGAAAYTLQSNEHLYIVSIALSSNDATQALITVDSGGTTPTKWASQYLSATQPPGVVAFAPGTLRGIFGVLPRATASAVTTAKTVECMIAGYIAKT